LAFRQRNCKVVLACSPAHLSFANITNALVPQQLDARYGLVNDHPLKQEAF
jgi:hypothetical protein